MMPHEEHHLIILMMAVFIGIIVVEFLAIFTIAKTLWHLRQACHADHKRINSLNALLRAQALQVENLRERLSAIEAKGSGDGN